MQGIVYPTGPKRRIRAAYAVRQRQKKSFVVKGGAMEGVSSGVLLFVIAGELVALAAIGLHLVSMLRGKK